MACESKTLENILGRNKIKEVLYYAKEKMNNEKFQMLVKKMQNVEIENKIDFLLENINSLWDLIDIFEVIDLSREEIFNIFSRLQTIDIMAMKKIFSANLAETFISKELSFYIMTKSILEQKMINDNYEFITIIIN